jgi:serine/threonine-protein kinase HipA
VNGPLAVALQFEPERTTAVGRLALDGAEVVLEYDPAYLASGLNVNPYAGAPSQGLLRPKHPRATDGVHGAFADSLPDAWGRRLMERRLRRAGTSYAELNPLDRLALVGEHGRGALTYRPAGESGDAPHPLDIDRIASEVADVVAGDESRVVAELEVLGGSSGGARPKIHVALDSLGHALASDADLPDGYSAWIVKFAGSADSYADIGPLEAAYADVARRAGIVVSRTRLIAARTGPGYFATERFDRGPRGARAHMLSVAGMLEIDWATPNMTYENLIQLTRGITHDARAVREIYRRMVFNVLACNRDDHAKQHTFLMRPNGKWELAPAYDLTFSYGPNGWHYLTVNGLGENVTRADLLAVARAQSIADPNAIIDEVAENVRGLPHVAASFGVSRETLADVRAATARTLTAAR